MLARDRGGDLELAQQRIMGLMGHIMIHTASPDIAQRLSSILARISDAAADTQDRVVLVAVSKMQPDVRIDAILDAGQRVFGENRVQEAQARWAGRRGRYPDLELRLVGPLQTNKAEAAIGLFDVIETLDRPKLARALAKAQAKLARRPSIFVQVNSGEETQKAGVLPTELADLIAEARDLDLRVEGLMCIPPVSEPAGPHFALLTRLAAAHGLAHVSMGMSGDFETAIKFGATHVRVGSALFGERLERTDRTG